MNEPQKLSSEDIRFYRKPWFFFLSILLFWPLSLFLMLSGKTYYLKRGGQIVAMKRWSKGLLAVVILFGGLLFYAGIAAKQSPSSVTTRNTASDHGTASDQATPVQATAHASSPTITPQANNNLAACDSDDTKDAVKHTLEQNDGIQVLDMGNFAEITCPALNMHDGSCLPPSDKDRYCNANVSLNTGTTSMKIHLFYGPSGKPLIQVEQGAWTDWSKLGQTSKAQPDQSSNNPNSTGDAECDKQREQAAQSGQNQPLNACTNPDE